MAIKNCNSAVRRKRRRVISSEVVNPEPVVAKLGDDVLVEILIRLPNPRSACQCKPVCKRWNSLISTTQFNRRFVSIRTKTEGDNFFIASSDAAPLKSILCFLPPLPPNIRRRFRVLDSSKDLLLCGFPDKINGGYCSHSYLICNPFSKQWIALPLAPRKPLNLRVVARLLCQPRSKSNAFDLGGGKSFTYHDYEFRVVLMHQWKPYWRNPTVLDVFSSESGEWSEKVCVLKPDVGPCSRNVVSCNGELFWPGRPGIDDRCVLAAFDAFSIESPPARIRDSSSSDEYARLAAKFWDVSISQGALHVVILRNCGRRSTLTLWRLGQNRRFWRRQYRDVLLDTSKCEDFQESECCALVLHPEDSEIVFLEILHRGGKGSSVFSCHMREGELELFDRVRCRRRASSRWRVFRPRLDDCLPTMILPRYDELRGKYDGSLDCLVSEQRSNNSLRMLAEEGQPVDRVEQLGHQRRNMAAIDIYLHIGHKHVIFIFFSKFIERLNEHNKYRDYV
ncbi:unnamed protein product [Linum trigynum]|uniref:F-box domain-containing protein n=1 Tax=Linum trigynum TaxID=586398 RepID=A0AAV2DFA0_9ROSI